MENQNHFSFAQRAAEKAAARAQDEHDLAAGVISAADLSRVNGGGRGNSRYVGPSLRIQRLAAKS